MALKAPAGKPDFFPCRNRLPSTGFGGCVFRHFSTDAAGRGVRTPHDDLIEYRMNAQGFRSGEFVPPPGGLVVMVIGCSISFGNGIPAGMRFGEVFGGMVGGLTGRAVAVYNLAWPGESGDYVSRVAAIAVPLLKPDVLLTTFPHFARREYFNVLGDRYDHRPSRLVEGAVDREVHGHFVSLASDAEDAANFFVNYKLVESVTRLHGTEWYFAVSGGDEAVYRRYVDHYDEGSRAPCLVKRDLARDGGHPGVLTNRDVAEGYFRLYAGGRGG